MRHRTYGLAALGSLALIASAWTLSCGEEAQTPSVRAVTKAQVATSGEIRLPAGLAPQEVFLAATEELRVNDGVSALGQLASTGTGVTNIGVSADVGDLVSSPSVELRNNATVQGSVKSGQSVSLAPGATITGGVTQNGEMGADEVWAFDFPGGTGANVLLGPQQAGALTPGTYGGLNIGAGAVLTLQPGVFSFEAITLEPGSRIKLAPDGLVNVYVKGQVLFAGKIEAELAGDDPHFALICQTSADIHLNAPFHGTVIAPSAKVVLASVSSGRHRGQFVARSIEVHQNQTIEFVRYQHWPSLWRDEPDTATVSSAGRPRGIQDILGTGLADQAILRFFKAAFENDDEQEYAAARQALLALPTSTVVQTLESALDSDTPADLRMFVFFVAGVIQDPAIVPIYQSAIDATVPLSLLEDRDPHEHAGEADLFALDQVTQNLQSLVRLGVVEAREPLLDAVVHPLRFVRRTAVFRIIRVASYDPYLYQQMLARLLPGDIGFLSLREATLQELAVQPPPADELGPVSEVARGPSSGGVLPTCVDGELNQDESDVDCGGDCDPCPESSACNSPADCTSGTCQGGTCVSPSHSGCVDLGGDGNNTTVAANACVKVHQQYPSWWETRTMQLQTTTPGTYPVPFTWSNACGGASGSGTFTSDWQNQFFGPTNEGCATLINFEGPALGTITVRYYGP